MFEDEVAHRLMERLRLARWLRRFPPRLVWASFVFINGFVAVAILAGLAVVSHTPFVFPSVGPTAFLLYFMPRERGIFRTSTPRVTRCARRTQGNRFDLLHPATGSGGPSARRSDFFGQRR